MRIVVTGLIGSIPLAGLTLHYLQYVLGLRQLGHDVLYLEDTGNWYYDPKTDSMVDRSSLPLDYLAKTMATYGLDDRWTFVDLAARAHGATGEKLNDFLNTAHLLINVTGAGLLRDEYLGIPHRAYVDTDPGYVQVRVAKGSRKDLDHLRRHTIHFSFGCNIGTGDCSVPVVGLKWHPTVQPICLELWPVAPPADPSAPFTTVLKWQTYGSVNYRGEEYGGKDTEFMRFQDLPQHTEHSLELAATGPAPAEDLRLLGWRLRDGRHISHSFASYRRYIHRSRGEWSVAKGGYVKMRSGWFGDRSASYLASGRPVVLQSTGWEKWLPNGDGLLAFSTLEQCCSALERIDTEYQHHCRHARLVAEQHFEAHSVLGQLVDLAVSSPTQDRRTGVKEGGGTPRDRGSGA